MPTTATPAMDPQGDGAQATADASIPAPELPLPVNHICSVEYPGYVRDASVPQAIRTLGGQASLDTAFRRNASKHDALLELNLRPDNPFSHPVPGDVVPTNNILLKVVKRKRRPDGSAGNAVVGEYTTSAVGIIPKTARFRSMVDFQFQPDINDPVAKLRVGMAKLDVDAVAAYRIPPEKEDYSVLEDANAMDVDIDPELTGGTSQGSMTRSNLRLFPPPLFTRQGIPQNYFYKANPMSVITTTVDEETGEEKKRLINKMRWKGYGPASIMFSDSEVPKKPPANVEQVRGQYDEKLIERLAGLFQQRPVWTRASIFNQFTASEAREIHNSKVILPLACYVFQDGPWRDTLLRFGYDPRQNVEARFYQRLYFRNLNHPIARPSVVARRQESRYAVSTQNRSLAKPSADERRSHIFDGVTVTSETAAFQLCDITDPMLKDMIEDDQEERDGWYTTHALEQIKIVLRHKFFSLLEGYIATDEECIRLLEQQETRSTKPLSRKIRPGKHNMAKGAVPAEDIAAVRLRAALTSKRQKR
ncbi:RNA polymerase III transcription factor IIIC subunit-domain-containing protein [Amylostereum chailletii]|nr:RNA polymerase III transcription factor IIIC subunit-domain-containing protein [Amylostereum chailletii]